MAKNQVWAVYNYDKGEVEKVFRKKHEARDYVEENEDCVAGLVDLNNDEDHEVQFGLVGSATVREVLDAMKKEGRNEDIELDDGPTPDEEEAACEAYGLKKPE